jgi:hypothetical protein
MRKNKQLIVSNTNGDCFRACMTSLLGIKNDPGFPEGGDPKWFVKWHKFLWRFGLGLVYEREACWRGGYWIASVKSKNYKDTTHAIVMKGSKVWFDPSTKKRYRVGMSLLDKDVVVGGHFLEVVNPTKLKKIIYLPKITNPSSLMRKGR